MSGLRVVTDADFESVVLGAEHPVLVDFWAEWCGPCHQLTPILAEIAGLHGGRMHFVALDVEQNPVSTTAHRVIGLPALLVFRDGEVVKRMTGAKSRTQVLSELAEFLR